MPVSLSGSCKAALEKHPPHSLNSRMVSSTVISHAGKTTLKMTPRLMPSSRAGCMRRAMARSGQGSERKGRVDD